MLSLVTPLVLLLAAIGSRNLSAHALPTSKQLDSRTTAWQSTPIVHTDAGLAGTASAAAARLWSYSDSTNQFAGIGWWQAANAYSGLFKYDLATKSGTFAVAAGKLTALIGQLAPSSTLGGLGLVNDYNDDSLWYANACLDGYAAYGSGALLDQADHIWTWVHTTSQIMAGGKTGVARTEPVSTTCNMVGGVYWTSHAQETYVNSITTALFMQVSARLYAIKKDPQYLNAATAALAWIQANTLDKATGLVVTDGVTAGNCSKSTLQGFTYNTGVYIAGNVALAKATSSWNYLWAAELAAENAMTTGIWSMGNGIITEVKSEVDDDNVVGFRCKLCPLHAYPSSISHGWSTDIVGFVSHPHPRHDGVIRGQQQHRHEGAHEGFRQRQLQPAVQQRSLRR